MLELVGLLIASMIGAIAVNGREIREAYGSQGFIAAAGMFTGSTVFLMAAGWLLAFLVRTVAF